MMKKKQIRGVALVLAALLAALSLAGCSSKGKDNQTTTGATTAPAGTTAAGQSQIEKYYDYPDLSKYITLGTYKGVEYRSAAGSFSAAETLAGMKMQFDYAAQGASQSGSEVPEGLIVEVVQTPGKAKVEKGDVIEFDFDGNADGVSKETLDGMSTRNKKSADLVVGSDGMIPGFEDQLIGKPIGKKFDFTVTFPENYQTSELQGKEATFTCTIHKIGTYSITDEKVNTLTQGQLTTVAQLEDDTRKQMAQSQDMQAAYEAAYGNAKIIKLPEKEKKANADMLEAQGKSMDENSTYSRQQFLKDYTITQSWDEYVTDSVKESTSQELFVYAVAAKENMSVTAEQLTQLAQSLRDQYGMDTSVTDDQVFSYRFPGGRRSAVIYVMQGQVAQFVYENAKAV